MKLDKFTTHSDVKKLIYVNLKKNHAIMRKHNTINKLINISYPPLPVG